ncbi:copper amine oxidase N-terminal domain-containing protein [Paenibacillus sp. NPDC058174]|uniref:copper amine oxidase N-terminal domain-containing protein n=1 Tax=Paenibacillus sp. NPDC058174 TaxID=3346366 RepID=UPI0036DA8A91
MAVKMKRSFLMLLAVLVVVGLLPGAVFAANESAAVEVRFKIGSSTVNINGENLKVQAPYEANGTTMVPLSVITKAFGATLQLQDNKIITLTYNDKKVVVTIGSKTVKVNNVSKTVTVAPVIVKNTTMVPVRVIVEAFGATIGKDSATKETVIKGSRANSAGGGSSINTDYGKTKVGDSYLGWSMNYPPGLALANQSDDGSLVFWADAKSSSSVVVATIKNIGELASEEVRQEIQKWFGSDEVVLDKRTTTVGGYSVEKFVTRTKERELLFEYRGIAKGEDLYLVMIGISGKERSVLDPYQTLLNSFSPSFDKSDKQLKDITKVVNGLIEFHDKDYGLKVKLPSGWYRDSDSTNPVFFSKDSLFQLEITSLTSGDTAESWLQRRQDVLKEDFLPSYLRNVQTSEITLQGGKALVLSSEFTYDQKTWYKSNEVLFVAGNYRYALDFNYDVKLGAKGEELFQKTMATVKLDTAFVEKEFGLIEDEYDTAVRSKKITKKSNAYKYSVELPAFWTGVETNFESDEFFYVDKFGSFAGYVYEDDTVLNVSSSIIKDLRGDKRNTIASSSSTTIGGKPAEKLVVKYLDSSNLPSTDYVYFVEHNGNVLLLVYSISDANATTAALDRLEAVIQSIKFL